MPLDKDMSHSEMVAELINTYKKTGKIGATVPRDMEHALEIANAVAYNIGESKEIQLVNKEVEEMNLEEILSSLEGYLSSKEKELGIADEALEDGATVKVTLDNGQSFDVPVDKDTKEEEIKKMYPKDKEIGVQSPSGQPRQARVKDVTLLKPVGEDLETNKYYEIFKNLDLDKEVLENSLKTLKAHNVGSKSQAQIEAIEKILKEGVSEDFEGEEPQAEVIENPINVVSMDIPLLLRILEWAREDSTKDEDLHFLTENLIKAMINTEFLAMEDYESVIPCCCEETPAEELDLPMEVEEETMEESFSEDSAKIEKLYGVDLSKNLKFDGLDEVPEEWQEYITDSNETFEGVQELFKKKGYIIEKVNMPTIETNYITFKVFADKPKAKETSVMEVFRVDLLTQNAYEVAQLISDEINDRFPEILGESMSEEDMGDMGTDPIAPVGTVQPQIGKTKKGKALKRTYKVNMPRH